MGRLRAPCWVAAIVLSGLAISLAAHAGAQREESLSDSVRTALSAAVQGQGPPVLIDPALQREYAQWIKAAMPVLDAYLRRSGLPKANPLPNSSFDEHLYRAAEWSTAVLRQELLQTVWYESRRAGLEPAMVLAVMEVESSFRKYAVSRAGARGLMQVMPFWTHILAGGDASQLFHLQANVRYGCVILRHYLNMEKGNWLMALGRYNGSRGQTAYPKAVMSAHKRWNF